MRFGLDEGGLWERVPSGSGIWSCVIRLSLGCVRIDLENHGYIGDALHHLVHEGLSASGGARATEGRVGIDHPAGLRSAPRWVPLGVGANQSMLAKGSPDS